MHNRYPALALLLSFVFPGLGHVYAGRSGRAYKIFFFGAAAVYGSAIYFLATFAGFLIWILVWALWHIISGIDACFAAIDPENGGTTRVSTYLSFIAAFVVVNFVGINSLRILFFHPFRVPASSMAPTIHVGDYIMTKCIGLSEPDFHRGDIATFVLAEDPKTFIVKRVIALPGEKVEVKGKEVFINGTPLVEPYAQYAAGGKRDFPAVTVPPGSVFVLGDNRDQSKDSRYWVTASGELQPFLPFENIFSVAKYIYWNKKEWRSRKGISLTSNPPTLQLAGREPSGNPSASSTNRRTVANASAKGRTKN